MMHNASSETGDGARAQVVIGLDVGTTGVKAAAFGITTPSRQLAIREYPLIQPAAAQAVQDPGEIIAAATAALRECVAACGDAEVAAVSLCAAMHGLIGLDAELRPLTPLIIWADARASQEAQWLKRTNPQLHQLTGVPLHPMTPLSKLVWFARHEPETLGRARWWVGLKELLVAWLTGRLVTELSSASGTGLLDLQTRTWSPAAVELAGVKPEQLPPILPTSEHLPLLDSVAEDLGLRAGTPVVLGAADGPLGNLGTGAIAPGVASLSLGTSGAVRIAVDTPRVDDAGSLFCFALTDSVWVLGGAVSNGASVIRWVRDALVNDGEPSDAIRSDDEVLEAAAGVAPGSDGLIMLPYLLTERAPLWDPGLLGAYLGLHHAHTRAHLARAAVEGVCMHLRRVVDRLDELSPVTSIRATGGAFRSELWREVMAAVLARPLHIVGEVGGTALGAAALGAYAVGRAPTLDDAVALLAGPTAAPAVEIDPQLVDAYERWRALVPERIAELARVARLLAPDERH